MWQKCLIHIMWSNTFPFVEGHLLPSGAWFQNPDGPKRFHLWCMSAQFPLLCTLALCCFRWFFWGLLVRVLLHYQKLSPTVLLHLPSHSFFFFTWKRSWWYFFYKSEDFWTTFRKIHILNEENTLILLFLIPWKRSELVWVFLNIKN